MGEDLRHDCMCPIQRMLLHHPVVAADGYSYEQSAIENWFSEHGTSPMTNMPMSSLSLVPNITLAKITRSLHKIDPSDSDLESDDGHLSGSDNSDKEHCAGVIDIDCAIADLCPDLSRASIGSAPPPLQDGVSATSTSVGPLA